MPVSNFASLEALAELRSDLSVPFIEDRHCMTVRVAAIDEEGRPQFATLIMEANTEQNEKYEMAVKVAVRAWSKVMGNEVLSVVMELDHSEKIITLPVSRPQLQLIRGGGAQLLGGAVERTLKLVGYKGDVRETVNQLDVYLP